MMRFWPVFFLVLALPVYAAEINVQPNALIIKHTEDEVANNPAVIAAKSIVGLAVAADMNASAQQREINQQIGAAGQKYMQESRGTVPSSPEEYQQFLQDHQQRSENLNSQMRAISSARADTHRQAKQARERLQMVTMQARIDDPAYRVFVAEGTSWEERKEDGRLVPRIILRDSADKRYSLITPQPVDHIANCSYQPVWGEVWAIRSVEEIAPDPKAPKNALPVLKINGLPQIYLLNHAALASCPFGQVLVPVKS